MSTATLEQTIERIVNREVHTSASQLVQELSSNEKYQDEILEFSTKWEEGEEGTNQDEWYPVEALEFWIISDWLADKLQNHGELITKDFYGLCIWGRTTSGQAISSDCVIQQIAEEIA